MTGQHEGKQAGLLIGASGASSPGETNAICPFDLGPAVPPDKVDLHNSTFERFTVPRKYARPLAAQGFEQLEAQECRSQVPGEVRNLKVNVRITDLSSRPMLLPVWVMAYRYQDRRFPVSGQRSDGRGKRIGAGFEAQSRRSRFDRNCRGDLGAHVAWNDVPAARAAILAARSGSAERRGCG